MKYRQWWIAVMVMGGLAAACPAEAAWVWSPRTGWIGPSGAVKDTPEAQLAYAVGFFAQPDYEKARLEFQKLLKHYKDSPQAPEASYYIGRCREERADYYEAFLAYRKTLQVYPSTARFEELLERMYQIGNYFLAGKKRRLLGAAALLPARDKAVEIFQAVAEDGPFSQYGELAQYKLGLAHLALNEYEQAVSAFEQLIERHPDSVLIDDARFQLAQASLKGTFKPDYDQHPTDQAMEELDAFVKAYPQSELAPEAVERMKVLRERRAEHEFMVARFYERRHHRDAARIYYDALVSRFPDTAWAERATVRLGALGAGVR